MTRIGVCSSAATLVLAAAAFAQDRLICVDSSRALSEVSMTTGAKTPIGTVSVNAGTTAGLTRNPATGTIYLTSTGNDSLYTLDLVTGVATLVGAFGDPALVMHGLEWDVSTGTLYGASSHTASLYTINPATGVATLIGPTGLTGSSLFTNLAHVPSTDTMFASVSGDLDSFYLINRATGAATLIGSLAPSVNPNALAYNTANSTLYLADNNTDVLYTIDLATGVTTTIGSMGAGNVLGLVYIPAGPVACYANCDGSSAAPVLTANDFQCFLDKFAANESYANCDGSTAIPTLTANDFQCFLNAFAAGCS